jgi:eukaryotic-like serine/threonine-protein kinase
MTPLQGEHLTKPTYAVLGSLTDAGASIEVKLYDHQILAKKVVQKTVDMVGLRDAVAYKEPRLLDTIRHPHVVPVFEAQFDPVYPDAITFVMPYYSGGSVDSALLRDYRFSVHQVRTLACHALDALAHVHASLRYVHRDVKPGNILLSDQRDEAFLSDFGSAAEIEGDGMVAAADMTLLYKSPEAGTPAGRVGVTADIYSMGMTAFEMLSGRFPMRISTPPRSREGWHVACARCPIASSPTRRTSPPGIRRAINKALRRDPASRYPRAHDFIRALEQVRCIDWQQADGEDPDGVWYGTWPPHLRADRRRSYRVTSRLLRGGRRRLEAVQRLPEAGAGWRRFGVADATTDPDDDAVIARFFAAVEAKAAQLLPAR